MKNFFLNIVESEKCQTSSWIDLWASDVHLSTVYHLQFTIPHHIIYDSPYGVWFGWHMEYGKFPVSEIQASHYIHKFIYLLNHIIRHFGSQIANGKNMNCKKSMKDLEFWIIIYAKKKYVQHLTIVTNSKNHRHINSAPKHNIFNMFLLCFTSSISNLCAVCCVYT